MLESDEESYFSEEESIADSDAELQEAFASGELKPGLVVRGGKLPVKAPVINDVERMKTLLNQIKLPSTFNWIERLDIVNDLAALAPEIAVQLDEHREKREKEIRVANARKKVKTKKGSSAPLPDKQKSIDEDPIHNDFKREMAFHRQAQQAIMTCLPRLKALGIPTKRPDDYFAEMAKSDTHMQKVASVLLKKQTVSEKAEKVRKMREQKKFAKQTQVHVLQERQKAKKEMIESVKKYRKGQKNNLDFLEEKKSERKSRNSEPFVSRKREAKNDKYGYGGKKKGSKWNTKESLDEVPEPRGGRSRGGRGGDRGGRGDSMSRGGGRGGRGDSRGGSRDRGDSMSRGGGRGGRGDSMPRGGGRGGRGDSMSRGGGRGRGGFGRGGGGDRGSRGGFGRGGGDRGSRGGFGRGGGGDRGGGRGRGGFGRGGGGDRDGGGRGGRGRGGGSRGKVNRPGKEARMKSRTGT